MMYEEHFRLTALPFSIAPDPRFLYMSARHREAIAHLLYGVRGEGGFVLLTGEIGTGKTTLCRCLLEQIHDQCDVAFILNPKLGVRELLATICDEFHIQLPAGAAGIKQLVDAINHHLLRANAEGRRAVLIVDEAQNLQPQVLELLRLLTNLETNTRKLLQIILIGQPELQEMLAEPEMRQVAQRIVARYHLTSLSRSEVPAYVKHRLRVSGTLVSLFPEELMGPLYRLTQGVPRLINLVCDRALLGAYVQGKHEVTRATLRRAAREVFGAPAGPPPWRRLAWRLSLLGGVGALLAGGYALLPRWSAALPGLAPPAVAAVAQSAPHRVAAPAAVMPAASPAKAAPAQAPVAASRPPPPADKLDWPDEVAPRARSDKLAFRDLFALYGVAYDPATGGSPCLAAVTAHLRCLPGRGGLADLLGFNAPALLTMDAGGGPYQVVLVSLEGQEATFKVAGETRRLPIADIARAWSGNYTLLWQAPPGVKDSLAMGSHGPAVSWLRHGLARALGGKAAADAPAVFDDELYRQVKAFQFSEGITPDGVAGALTLVHLDMRLDRKLPRLSRTTEAGNDVLHP